MGLYTVKPAVKNLIDLINACGDQNMDIISVTEHDEFADAAERLSVLTRRFEPIARDYIWKGSTPTADDFEDFDTEIEDAIRRYDTLRRGRIILERIVTLSRRPHKERSSIQLTSSAVTLDELRLAKSKRYRTEKGKLITPYEIRIVKHPSLLDALDGSMARIRKCAKKECGNFFWAGKGNKTECSERCNDAIRSARYRAKKKKKHDPQSAK